MTIQTIIEEPPANAPPPTKGAWAIRIEGVGKQYRLGAKKHLTNNLREEIVGALRSIVGAGEGEKAPMFWALRGVNLEVARGESVGILGRNGAGKSTLLKVLSRITPPTEGEIRYRGRLASLLEVGTGFHRELTGRENVFLNGAILGMRHHEIQKQFDAIVDFAEIEKFLDTPVKFYSSGMYVRLAFAVAAHLKTDILVVDEVLAVGDAAFQKKCLGKMRNAATDGRTVLFVSHDLAALQRLCPRAVWLVDGAVAADGEASDVVRRYLESGATEASADVANAPRLNVHGTKARFTACRLVRATGEASASLGFGEPFALEVSIEGRGERAIEHVSVVVGIEAPHEQTRLASACSEDRGVLLELAPGETKRVRLTFGAPDLAPGRYAVTLTARTGRLDVLDHVAQCVRFDVMDVPHEGRALPYALPGAFRLNPEWEVI